MGFCIKCGGETKYNPDEGADLHPLGSTCEDAVPPHVREARQATLRAAIVSQGRMFYVVPGFKRGLDGEREEAPDALVALRNGRYHALDYTWRDEVRAGYAYLGVFVEPGVGSRPYVVTEEEGRESFFVALDPSTETVPRPADPAYAKYLPRLDESPLVFEVQQDRDDPTALVALLKTGTVTRFPKHGPPRRVRGPFRVDRVLLDEVHAGDVFVGVPANGRFTHVFLDTRRPERVTELLAGPRSDLLQRVDAWDRARCERLARYQREPDGVRHEDVGPRVGSVTP